MGARSTGAAGASRRDSLQTLKDLFPLITDVPFAIDQVTAGTETELQAAVLGPRSTVDLPRTIEASTYFANALRRAQAGDMPASTVEALQQYLAENPSTLWENSWVRFPRSRLGTAAQIVLSTDLRSDRSRPSPYRADIGNFIFHQQGEEFLRLPISYLLKLALAEALDGPGSPSWLRIAGQRFLSHFISDNTSPETHSFHIVAVQQENGYGQAVAMEAAKRYLLTELLIEFANQRFRLSESGQKAMVFASPHPPIRQKQLNDCVPDAFYRELFMSPCLSGWDRGEEKRRYMELCHEVLSRSQMNAVSKLGEAGIISRNLVVLPNPSNISLANNGIHISFGSRKLQELVQDPESGFDSGDEKYVGDLTIKIFEHFLPLFVGTYTASPYRLAFSDFHPEKVLGFLPHELDYTHLRMLWRRWRGKARTKVFGKSFTPFGPVKLDALLSRALRLRGDYVPDFRLLDYPVGLMSTSSNPALDGKQGNLDRLLKDLHGMGVFHEKMTAYLPLRLRAFSDRGFCGFEGRWYSLFDSFADMAHAANLQLLLHALAFHYVIQGGWRHRDVPDDPEIESERRQSFFATAIGVPTIYVRTNTQNRFLARIVSRTRKTRASRRYPGYTRVKVDRFRAALIDVVESDGRALIELFRFQDTLRDLRERIENPRASAAGKLTAGILDKAGASNPWKISARQFNGAAEEYYRSELRTRQIREAWEIVCNEPSRFALSDSTLAELRRCWPRDNVPEEMLRRAVALIVESLECDRKRAGALLSGGGCS